jgi:tetratricopeptide (TPR) repeat protein
MGFSTRELDIMFGACAKSTSSVCARPWIALAAVPVCALAAYFIVAEFRVRESLQVAQRALERNDLDEAKRYVDQCLSLRPNAPTALLLAARIARLRDALNDAEQYLDTLDSVQASSGEGRQERLLLSAQQGDIELVLQGIESRLKELPADSPEAGLIMEAMAKGFMEQGAWEDAIRWANGLCALPSRPPSQAARHFFLRGMIWEKVTQFHMPHMADAQALADFVRAVELDAKHIDARLHLAGMLYQVGRPSEAATHFECVRGCRADLAEVLLGLARCRIALAQFDDADRALDALVSMYPDHSDGLLECGRQAFHRGQFIQAEEWLRHAARAAPPYATEPYRLLRLVLLSQQKEVEAREVQATEERIEAANRRIEMLTVEAGKPGANASLCCAIGRGLTDLGQPQAGTAWYLTALRHDPRCVPAHEALADHFDRLGQNSRAARHRQKAREAGQ